MRSSVAVCVLLWGALMYLFAVDCVAVRLLVIPMPWALLKAKNAQGAAAWWVVVDCNKTMHSAESKMVGEPGTHVLLNIGAKK